jgi:subtilisin-like proprotein convertase family protein
MNRRTLLLAGLATLPATVLPRSIRAQRRPRRRQASTKPTARRQGGGLTASHVRTRVITRTFTSNVPMTIPGTAVPIPGPASVYPSIVQVRGLTHGRIVKVRATLIGLSHTSPDNLDIMLVAPGNVGVILMSDAGGGTDATNLTVIFDQDAPGRLPDPLVSGAFQPLNNPINLDDFPAPAPQGVTGHSLTRFNNRNPNGSWQLFVFDDFVGDSGSLAGWSLTIQARVRVPHRHRRRARQRPAHRGGR